MIKISELAVKTKETLKGLLGIESLPQERVDRRVELCSTCSRITVDPRGNLKCGTCACSLKGDRLILTLAQMETREGGDPCPLSRWSNSGV